MPCYYTPYDAQVDFLLSGKKVIPPGYRYCKCHDTIEAEEHYCAEAFAAGEITGNPKFHQRILNRIEPDYPWGKAFRLATVFAVGLWVAVYSLMWGFTTQWINPVSVWHYVAGR